MALADLPTAILTSRTRDEHITDHNRLHTHTADAVHSGDYTTLQDALNDAFAKHRPLVIAPGTHVITAALDMTGMARVQIHAYGATIQAGANMATMIDMKNCTRCSWYGVWLNIPDGRVVDNAIYVYYDSAQCSSNSFYDVTIEGVYSVGVRIGKPTDNHQCDHMYFMNTEFIGRAVPGQIGIYVGTGVYANCLNHTFINTKVGQHTTHIVVDSTNAYFENVFMDTADVDFSVTATVLTVRNVRSESAGRFLVTGGPTSYPSMLNFEDVMWNADEIASNGEYVQVYTAGLLCFRNLDVRYIAAPATIKARPSSPLVIKIDGMASTVNASDVFDVNVNTIKQLTNYMKRDVDGHLESITV